MEVRFHGAVYGSNVRHNYAELSRIRTERETIEQKIAALARQAAAGEPDGTEQMPALAQRKAELDQQVSAAEAAISQEQMDEENRKLARMPALIEEAKANRAEFVRLFREACVALGNYCANVGDALELVGLEARGNELGYSVHRSEVAQLSEPPRPFDGVTLKPTTHFGWNWSFPAVPLRETGGQHVGK